MATVQLADIYEPLTFEAAVDEAAVEKNRLIQSGIIVDDPRLTAMASAGGTKGDLPFYHPLSTASEPNYSSDDPASNSVPKKMDDGKMTWRLANMNDSWSTMDLSRELALKDPLTAITAKIGQYWATQIQKRVIQSLLGILADNDANDSDDMFYSVANDDAGDVTDAERISATVILQAKQTMGDAAELLTGIAMHSVCFTHLQSLNLIDYIPDSVGVVRIPTYLGYEVFVDDAMPAVSGTNRITYTSVLFGRGSIVNGQGKVATPSELERIASSGDGGGQDVIHSRRAEIIHPYGFAFDDSGIAGQSATLAELAAAAQWDRVVDRKNVPLAFLQTNG